MSTNVETNKGSISRRPLKLHKPVLSLDHITTRTPKSANSHSIFARFQARLNPHASTPSPLTTSTLLPEKPPAPKYLKIRLITWNMNESLPKGDLAALLGSVPPYQIDPLSAKMDLNIPGLGLETCHPYHLVLVAGQECPTLMGLPLGLGGGLKWDREEEERKKDKKDKEDGKSKKKEKAKDKDDGSTNPEPTPVPTPGTRTPSRYTHSQHHATGWSSILEDYFSRGIGSIPGVKPDITLPANTSLSSLLKSPDRARSPASSNANIQGMANKDANWNLPPGGADVPKTGPYELLTKERLMGIYLALYVHRDIRPLVENYSQSSVTAGLIGGRLGNKGGVAVSLKLDGTTFLFLNAHLAAHEDKAALRLSNMTKIKAELSIDDFLPANDERKMAEDPTDRFDHTFLCGDLNFRLDITRLHAEWLISQKKYAQAQEFDQLRKIMKGLGSHVFAGFDEAPIDFPPTFKYDVLHTLRGRKRKGKPNRRALSEVEEQERDDMENSSLTPGDIPQENDEPAESGSMVSRSTRGAENSSSSSSDSESESERDHSLVDLAKVAAKKAQRRWYTAFKSSPVLPSPVLKTDGNTQSSLGSKASIGRAAFSARKGTASKEAALGADKESTLSRATSSKDKKANVGLLDRNATIMAPPMGTRATTSMDIPRRTTNTDPSLASAPLIRSISTKSGVGSKTTLKESANDEEGLDIVDLGVYDTSSKQRVPSWCDRILFKTTIPIPPTPIQEELPSELIDSQESSGLLPIQRRATPLMESFIQAFRHKSRSDSTPSTATVSVRSAAAAAETRQNSTAKTSSTGGISSKRSSVPRTNVNGVPLSIVTSHEEMDSPIAISKSNSSSPEAGGLSVPENKDATSTNNQTTRRTTSPNVARGGSGGPSSSLRVTAKRRRSLSATLPRTSEPVELMGRMIPASASMPPVLPLEYIEGGRGSVVKGEYGSGTTPSKADVTPASGGGARAIRRILSFLGGAQTLPSSITPGTAQSTVAPAAPPKVWKKGEVQVLEYATLSDREMRRLEGRSDHRPVIGQYAVYL